MNKKVLTSAISLLLSTQVMAQSYQFEGNVNYLDVEDDFIDSYNAVAASGVYYFSPVKTDGHPLQEAAYLGKHGSLGVTAMYIDAASGNVFEYEDVSYEFESESTYSAALVVAETYFLNDFVYLGAMLSHAENRATFTESTFYSNSPEDNSVEITKDKSSDDEWRFNLGLAPVSGLLIWSEFEKDVDVSDSLNLNAKYVQELDARAFNVQGGIGKNAWPSVFQAEAFYADNAKVSFSGLDEDADVTSAYILGDYYFDNTLSVGVGAGHIDGDDSEDIYMIRGKKFFTDNFSLQAQYSQDDDADFYSVGASVRF